MRSKWCTWWIGFEFAWWPLHRWRWTSWRTWRSMSPIGHISAPPGEHYLTGHTRVLGACLMNCGWSRRYNKIITEFCWISMHRKAGLEEPTNPFRKNDSLIEMHTGCITTCKLCAKFPTVKVSSCLQAKQQALQIANIVTLLCNNCHNGAQSQCSQNAVFNSFKNSLHSLNSLALVDRQLIGPFLMNFSSYKVPIKFSSCAFLLFMKFFCLWISSVSLLSNRLSLHTNPPRGALNWLRQTEALS